MQKSIDFGTESVNRTSDYELISELKLLL